MADVLSAAGLQKIVLSKDAGGNVLPLFNLDPSARNTPKETAPAREAIAR